MAIRGVIFDLGHTLMHLKSTWPEIFERGAADLAFFVSRLGLGLDGRAFSRALLERRRAGFARAKKTMREVTAEDSMRWAFAHFGISDVPRKVVRGAIEAFFAYEATQWFADPDALAVLRELSTRKLHLGMFSNATDDRFIHRIVDRFGFSQWLDPALTSARTGIRKPDPHAFAPILTDWNLCPESVVMVGDCLEADILGASRAGIHSVWIRSREDARQEDDAGFGSLHTDPVVPDATIAQLSELPGYLERQWLRSKV